MEFLGLVPVLVLAILYLFAKADVFITFVRTGEAVAIMVGDSVSRIIVNSADGVYCPKEDKIYSESDALATDPDRRDTEKFDWPNWHEKLGIYWVGPIPVYYRVLSYDFSWPKYARPDPNQLGTETDQQLKIIRRHESVSSLILRYPYPIEVKGIELDGNVKATFRLLATIEVIKPRRTLFNLLPTGIWLDKTLAVITGRVRDMGGRMNVNQVRTGQHGAAGSEFEANIKTINTELLNEVGVEIRSVNFQNFEIENPELQRAFEQEARAQQEAKAAIAQADGQAQARERLATARRKELEDEGAGYERILTAADTPDKLEYLTERVRAETKKDWKPSVYVEGGSSAHPLINTSPPAPPTP